MQTASKILMIRPAAFGYNAETAQNNYFQTEVSGRSPQDILSAAQHEFDRFAQTLTAHGIEVIIVEDTPSPVKPDAIFPNNWFCTFPNGKLMLFPMYAENRRLEVRQDILDMLKKQYIVTAFEDWTEKIPEGQFLESTGSMVFDHDNKIAYACLSQRTDKELFRRFCDRQDYKPVAFNASDKSGREIYHTNVMMHVGETYAVICLEAIDTVKEQISVADCLRTTGHSLVNISYEQMQHFAGNMLQVHNAANEQFTLLSKTAHASLTTEQKQKLKKHTKLLPVDITTIETIGGGSVRCMMAEIFLDKIHEQ
ncbi:citrulline utilization hydrolase CtlX [Haoranjiania flava]|uniref:Arginine deiminase-related protein n=1 Tax=Haoranjiania flava TaxID=1856322 RepID=A0AAE3IMY0_9BACT|nr:arginine deiminase-related protein [Haoranjiania flava]MCU7693256.1 arginine deiminase-related protein [Haoranjiania flava]